jgi:hypothetical protein
VRAAEKLSDLATAIDASLQLLGREPIGERVRTVLTSLLLFPLLVMLAGILLALHFYDAYPTLRDEALLVAMLLAGTAASILYTAIAYLLLRNSVSRGARAMLIGVVALMGFVPGSPAPSYGGTAPGRRDPASVFPPRSWRTSGTPRSNRAGEVSCASCLARTPSSNSGS